MLIVNAENLMTTVADVLKAAETAAIRIPLEAKAQLVGLTWIKTDNLLF